jgi:hypothetical protein
MPAAAPVFSLGIKNTGDRAVRPVSTLRVIEAIWSFAQ